MLSDKLGGRKEVLETPFYEVLGHVVTKFEEDERQVEKEQMEYYMNFVAMLNSSPQNEKQAKASQKFMDTIKPQLNKKKSTGNKSEDLKNKYQWNERVQRKIEAKQRKEAEKQKE